MFFVFVLCFALKFNIILKHYFDFNLNNHINREKEHILVDRTWWLGTHPEHGPNHLTRSTPRGPEVNDDQLLSRAPQQVIQLVLRKRVTVYNLAVCFLTMLRLYHTIRNELGVSLLKKVENWCITSEYSQKKLREFTKRSKKDMDHTRTKHFKSVLFYDPNTTNYIVYFIA